MAPLVAAGFLLPVFFAGCVAPIQVRPQGDPARVQVVVPSFHGDPAALTFALVDPGTGREGPPILGDARIKEGALVFTPRYPLSPGQRYRARLEGAAVEYRVPERPPREPATVEAIYPSGETLPANLLRFYIHFSRPMREGLEIFDQIQILDEDGRAVRDPWRRVDLWSPDSQRLTLYVHPGRIKRGVNLREEFGPVLEPGRTYRLVIGAEVTDSLGQPLGRSIEKRFRTAAEDRERPSLSSWIIEAPHAATRRPLVVSFPKSMDRWLLVKHLSVIGPDGRPLLGSSEVGTEERSWSFTPEKPWTAGSYTLNADPFLEDQAGNTPVRRFEEDATAGTSKPGPTARPFQVASD